MMELMRWVGLMLYYALFLYQMTLFVYILLGWFMDRRQPFFVFLGELCEPALRLFRRITQNRLVIGQIDLSPILLFFCLSLLQNLVAVLFLR
ncbi:MAG: YggT family protein [Kangiellaceae bacterium]|jgi:uncharacterized protein YggT (Ycf19 family)|nr:YggT family protein [Kangiellaceae bacterium]